MQFPIHPAGLEDTSRLVEFFCEDIRNLTEQQLTAYPGGWPNHLPMALLDAVFSIRAQYSTKYGKGLAPRLKKFKDTYPLAAQDLHEFLKLTESQISDILGYGVTASNPKARAALQVANNLANLEIQTVSGAQDFDPSNHAHRHAYLDVHGLGKVTFRYFTMLLGRGDVKPDVWIIRAIQRVADTHELDISVTPALAWEIVTSAHAITGLGETVTHLDHAIWLNERAGEVN